MKNLFGVNLKTKECVGEKFIVRRADGDINRKQEKLQQDAAVFEKSATLPVWINVCGLVLFFLGTVLLGGFLDAISDGELSFAEAYARAAWIFITGLCALAVGLAVMIAGIVKRKRALGSSAYRYLKENESRANKEAYEAFGVPESAKAVDVIASAYRAKAGKTVKENAFTTSFINAEARVYCENGALCFAFTDLVYAVPLERILRVQKIGKRISAQRWNKEIPFNKGEYKKYKITCNSSGMVSVKPYYKITVRDENYEEYYIAIPPYDFEAVLPLTSVNLN